MTLQDLNYPPRAEIPFALKGRYPGLRTGRAAFPWAFGFCRPFCAQWHRGTPLQSLTVAGAAQE